ncbi:MAG: hypothetical protein CMI12_00050 [Oceanospirillum sp.]|nr:hypothetical protein [Oceanospirillum sp.]
MAKSEHRRINIRISDPGIMKQMETGGVQSVIEPMLEGGAILKESGVLDQLLFFKQQGLIDDIGSLQALRMAIDFAEKIDSVRQTSDVQDGKTEANTEIEPSSPALSETEIKTTPIQNEARMNAFG